MAFKFRQATEEVAAALEGVEREAIERACTMIAEAGNIGLYGCGREGLQMRGFAMRLYHLGLRAAYVGEMAMPPLGAGDLLIASAGPGELDTVRALMRKAADAGARVLFVTAVPDTPSAALADHVIVVPAQTMASDGAPTASTMLPMGSIYEGALFFVFEIMIAGLRERLGIDSEQMRTRHTNME